MAAAAPAPAIQRLALPTYDARTFDPQAARAFLMQYENYAVAYALTDAQRVQTWGTALTGNAALWFDNLREAEPDLTWADARQKFEAYWTAPVPRANRAVLAADCKQHPGEEVRAFMQRCLSVAATAIPPPQEGALPRLTVTGADVTGNHDERTITTILTAEHGRVLTSHYFRKQTAANLFIAGCHQPMRQALLLTAAWDTWEDLEGEAIRLQETIAPHHIKKQLDHFAPVHAVAMAPMGQLPVQQQPQQPRGQQQQQPLQPPSVNAASTQGGKQKTRKPKSKPHPEQQKTHHYPVKCYYCDGMYHTERHCLAKQAAKAAAAASSAVSTGQQQPSAATSALQQAPPPPPPPPPGAGCIEYTDAVANVLASMDLGHAPPYPAGF